MNFLKPYMARKRVQGKPMYWCHDTNTWTPDPKEASRFDDEAVYRGGLPLDAEDIVLYRYPNEVVITIERMRRAS